MANYKYLKIASQLKGDMLLGNAAAGQRIPTELELVKRFGVGRNTIRQAVELLVGEGFLYKVQGSGTFFSDKIAEYKQKKSTAGRNKCIGVVLNQVNSYLFPNILAGISDYLFEHDYHMIIRMTLNQIARERHILSELLDSEVAGLIVEPARSGLPLVNTEHYGRIERQYPCVLLHASLPGFGFPTIDNDNEDGAALLVRHLIYNGHSAIAAICKADESCGIRRFRGYAAELQRHDLKVNENRVLWFVEEDYEDLFTDAHAGRVLSRLKDCSAVVCFNDDIARRFMPFAERHGLRIPDDLSVVGFDNVNWDHAANRLTTVEHPKEALGRAAAEALLTLFSNPFANVSRLFPPRFIERDTVRRLG
ncbi:MAG: GntR family transcriptional regulator [Planctomycetaceae bacterium]|nr:GntR family transcriptional regulator [Planctomycetaceae bacterium]